MHLIEVIILYGAILIGFWKIVEEIGGKENARNNNTNTTNRSSSSPNKRFPRRLKRRNSTSRRVK